MNLKWNTSLFLLAIPLLATLSFAAAKPAKGIHPVVDVNESAFFGGSANGVWIQGKKMKPMIKGGETYLLYTPKRYIGKATGGKVYISNRYGTPLALMVNITLPKIVQGDKSTKRDEPIIGVRGNWNALPRVPKVESTSEKKYQQVIHDILKAHGVTNAEVHITKILSVDLDGDGKEEMIIAASTQRKYFSDHFGAKKSDYSMVVVRKMIHGKVLTIPLEENIYSHDVDNAIPSSFTLESVLDVNGDGVMEVIIRWDHLEGYGKSINQVRHNKAKRVLAWGWLAEHRN